MCQAANNSVIISVVCSQSRHFQRVTHTVINVDGPDYNEGGKNTYQLLWS